MDNEQYFKRDSRYSSLIEPIETVIELIRRRWLKVELCKTILIWMTFFFIVSTLIILISASITLPTGLRLIIIMFWLVSVCLGPAAVIYLIFKQPDFLVLAEIAEKQCKLKHNYLINALQLSREKCWTPKLIHRLLAESTRAAEKIDPAVVIPIQKLRKTAISAIIAVTICSGLLLTANKQVKNGLSALFYPKSQSIEKNTKTPSDELNQSISVPANIPVYVSAHYPSYLQLADKQLSSAAGPLTIPEGTKLIFRIRTIPDLTKISLQTETMREKPFAYEKSEKTFKLDYLPIHNENYAVLASFSGKIVRYPNNENQYWPIKIIKDNPPTIKIADPAEDVSLPAAEKLKLIIVAQDDYKITKIKLIMKKNNNSTPIQTVSVTKPNSGKYTFVTFLPIPENASVGDIIEYWAQAKDNRNLPGKPEQIADSQHYKINIISKSQYDNRLVQSEISLIDEIKKIIKLQVQLRTKTLTLFKSDKRERVNMTYDIQLIEIGQKQIKTMLINISEKQYPSAFAEMIRTLKILVNGPAEKAETLANMLSSDIKKANSLTDIQQQIILTLQSILEMLGSFQLTDKKHQQTSKPAESIDIQQALEKLSQLLNKFSQQQQLAIKSTASLAAKNPEDFSQNDKALLDQLTQLQEQWEKFLNQAVTDMNKVANQDFSASVLRDELIEIQSQVKISSDAMKKQAIHMAISAEQVGLELAEELTHNLERWLAKEPDRKKWELEEPTEPIDVPLAELPEELEDIIGELIEQEEDLYDEIEDATSSWADSLDKGAGWDAVDGPISNYSAKGITGNVLPNANEIAGRSGEGRTGRASGEFVEKTAFGKGGRRTPTRLTKDAFQSGQIEDLSKDAPGGATGGGKLSGAGAEGLTGPTPQTPDPKLGGLRHKQAVLLAKAKIAHIQAMKHNWGNFQLDRIIALMSRNLSDMDRHAYRSVLARKTIILNSMRSSKTLISSKFQLDSPAIKMPKLLKAETQIIDENDISPETRSLIKRYYEKLSAIK